ncbi:MAG: TRAP transporter small permease [Gammaproteobacteria bacterium]
MKRLLSWLNWFDRAAIIVLLTLLVAVVFLQVASRFVFNLPIEWSEEMARFLFIWFCWLGCSYATVSFHHIRITAHLRLLPPVLAKFLLQLGDLLWIGFNAVVVVGGIMYLGSILEYPYRSMITDINMLWIFLPIPVIFLVFTLRVFVNLLRPDYVEQTLGEQEREAAEEVEIASSNANHSSDRTSKP